MKKKVVLACEQTGVALKKDVLAALNHLGFEVVDVGYQSDTEKMDPPSVVDRAGFEFKKGIYEFGVVICGNSFGVNIEANKIHGIRCVPLYDSLTASMGKKYNRVNFIAFGSLVKYPEPIEALIDAYVKDDFDSRHKK